MTVKYEGHFRIQREKNLKNQISRAQPLQVCVNCVTLDEIQINSLGDSPMDVHEFGCLK